MSVSLIRQIPSKNARLELNKTISINGQAEEIVLRSCGCAVS